MATRDSLPRVVFFTRIQSGGNWSDFGSLQLAFGTDAQNNFIYVVLYRVLAGLVYDISDFVTVTAIPPGTGSYHIVLPPNPALPQPVPDLVNGFTIDVTNLISNPTAASFTGTLNAESWVGNQCGIDTLPLSSVLSPPQPIPANVQAFLNISPLVTVGSNTIDQALQWAKSIFEDILVHSYSAEGQKYFFPNIGALGSIFTSTASPPNPPPTSGPFSLASIEADDQSLFQIAGVHLLCTALKTASWLDSNYQDALQDLSAPFFAMLTASDADLAQTETVYGASMPVIAQIPSLREQYRDVSTRCYFAAFACLSPQLVDYDAAGAAAMYAQVTSTLLSDDFKAHWVMEGTSGESDPRAQMLTVNLGLIHDKLVMLKLLGGDTMANTADWTAVTTEINSTLVQLDAAAMNTGLFGVTNVQLPSDTFSLDVPVGDIMSDEHLEELHERAIESQGGYNGSWNGLPPFDDRSYDADKYLLNQAVSLGLFHDVEPASESGGSCVIL